MVFYIRNSENIAVANFFTIQPSSVTNYTVEREVNIGLSTKLLGYKKLFYNKICRLYDDSNVIFRKIMVFYIRNS